MIELKTTLFSFTIDMDVYRLLFLLTNGFLSTEVFGLQMTITPSTVTLNSPAQQGLTMSCGLEKFEKNKFVKLFTLMYIERNSSRPGDPMRVAVLTGYNASVLPEGSDMGRPLHSGILKAKAGTTDQNEARLELEWEMSQVKCDFAGDYTCEVQWLEQDTFDSKTWSKTATLAMKTIPEKPKIQLMRNGVPVTPQPTNQTIASSYQGGDVLDIECMANIGSSNDKTLKWQRTRRSGTNLNDLMVANDGTPTTITDDIKNCTHHQTSMFKINVTADKFQTGSSKMLFLCEIDEGSFPSQPLQSQKIYIQLGAVTMTEYRGRNTVNVGETLNITCDVSPLTGDVVWYTPASHLPVGNCLQASRYSCAIHSLATRISLTSNVSARQFYLTLTDARVEDEGTYECKRGSEKGRISISVHEQITSVTLTSPSEAQVTVSENITATFVCETSAGRPNSTILWYKQLGNNNPVAIPGGSISTRPSGASVITTGTLKFIPKASDDKYRVYCTAYNTDASYTLTSEKKAKLLVQKVLSGSERSEESTQVSAGAIAGGVVAGIATIVTVAVVFYTLGRRRGHLTEKDKENKDSVGSKENHEHTSQERNENYDYIVSGPACSEEVSEALRSKVNHKQTTQGINENYDNFEAGSACSEDVSEAPRNVYEQLDSALRKERVYSAVDPTNENIKLDDAGAEYIDMNVHTP